MIQLAAAAVAMMCGSQPITIVYGNRTAELTAGDRVYQLHQVVAASGAKYEADGDPGTILWSRGRNAMLTLAGRRLPECVPVPPPFRAAGHEPGWSLEMAGPRLTLTLDNGQVQLSGPAGPPEALAAGRRHRTTLGGRRVAVTILERHCIDSMSGRPRPATVEVQVDGRTLRGCGGDPAALLTGAAWQVSDIAGAAVVPPTNARTRATIEFAADGKVSGSTACNRFSGRYTLTGEGLTVSGVVTTRMACGAPFVVQENAFLAILRSVRRYELTADGGLRLLTNDGRAIVANR